jgi:amino acid permease
MLTIPYALSAIGLVNGIIAIVVFGCTSFFTLYLLIQCAKAVGGRNVSFFSISSCTYPKLSIVFDLAVAIKCFGVSISYLVIIGELLPKVTLGLFPNVPKDSVCLTSLFWITVSMLIVVPLSFQKSLSSLRYASTISLISVSYIAILVAFFFFSGKRPTKNIDNEIDNNMLFIFSSNTTDDSHPLSHDISYFKWSLDFFRVLPIFIFAYTCHQNILTVFNEMKITSRRRDNRHKTTTGSTAIAIAIAITVYLTIGITGYLTFGNSTKSNIISMYPPSNKLVLIGQLLLAVMVSTCFALQCHPARKSFGNVINYLRTMKKRSGYEPLLDAEESPERGHDDEENDNESKPLLFKTRSQPLLSTTPLYIKKESQDPLNFASSSVSTTETSISNSVLKEPKLELSKSFNDLEYILNDSKKYQYQYHSITIPNPPATVNTNSIETQSFELSNTLHNCITSIILILAYTIACSVKDLGVVLSVVGATGSTTICFILPGILYYKIKKNERGDQKPTFLMKIALLTSIAGVLLMCNSLFFIFFNI